MILSHKEPVWVAGNDALFECCESLSRADAVAVDTEFMRSNTFYPKAALFQLYAGDQCYLVDPLPITDFQPLADLLCRPSIVKIFHACSEDLEVFNSFLNCVPEPLVDTQIAAALLPHGSSTAYAALVEKMLGVSLEKGETRSDWLQRPLAARQLQYAVQDVLYLLPLYQELMEELEQADRVAWLREDCELLVAAAKTPPDLNAFYPRIKSAWKLNAHELAVLRELSLWREQRARERDMPRNHVLHERVLWNLARQQPRDREQLKRVEGMGPREFKRVARDVLEAIERGLALDAEQHPEVLPAPLPIGQRDLVKALKQRVAEKAEQLELAPEVLAKKSDYDFLVRSGMETGVYRLPERLLGWRREIIGDSLLKVAEAMARG